MGDKNNNLVFTTEKEKLGKPSCYKCKKVFFLKYLWNRKQTKNKNITIYIETAKHKCCIPLTNNCDPKTDICNRENEDSSKS